jgi:hypothetical protein
MDGSATRAVRRSGLSISLTASRHLRAGLFMFRRCAAGVLHYLPHCFRNVFAKSALSSHWCGFRFDMIRRQASRLEQMTAAVRAQLGIPYTEWGGQPVQKWCRSYSLPS